MICLLQGVEDATCEYKASTNTSVIYVFCCQTGRLYVVGPVQQYNVDQAHADQQGDHGEGHDDILGEQSLSADKAAKETSDDDEESTYGAPPGYKEGRVVVHARAMVRRCVGGREYGVHDAGRNRARSRSTPQRMMIMGSSDERSRRSYNRHEDSG